MNEKLLIEERMSELFYELQLYKLFIPPQVHINGVDLINVN